MSQHANFIIVNDSRTALTIRDLGPHNKHLTITNDVEWVVEQLTHRLSGRKLFYYDSENQLDEILVKNGKFASFGPGPTRVQFGPGTRLLRDAIDDLRTLHEQNND